MNWDGPDGAVPPENVTLLNMSDGGALVSAGRKLPGRQFVTLQVPSLKLHCTATVRYCDAKGMKYLVGLEFVSPAEPKKPRWT